MTSLRTRRLPFLSAFLFLSIVPAEAEVMASVSDCNQFFLERSPPQLPGILEGGNILNQNRFKVICQTLKNQRKFVTLYDIENKIPVFSAYKYRGAEKGERPNTWCVTCITHKLTLSGACHSNLLRLMAESKCMTEQLLHVSCAFCLQTETTSLDMDDQHTDRESSVSIDYT